MVNEACVEEAVRIARRNPALRVGLHLTLCDGRASEISAITDACGCFAKSPAIAGMHYAFDARTHAPLAREIGAQFARLAELAFAPGHCDGHAHLHLHPTILRLAIPHLAARRFERVRLVREPGNRTILAHIFRTLSANAARALATHGIVASDHVFGLRDTGRMTTARFARILENLPHGTSELYYHPGAEPEALDFARLRELLATRSIVLV
jgi:predicted glycoside hydrolase/deacetylase ChbG (UPF0249 family)